MDRARRDSKLTIVYPTFPSGLFACVSPGLLALGAHAARRDPGMAIRIWDERVEGEFDPAVAEGGLLAISAMTAQVPRAKRIAERGIDSGAAAVAFGGIHPTVLPDEFLGRGSTVRGEIEGGSFELLLDDYLSGRPLAARYQTPAGSLHGMPLAPAHLYRYASRVSANMVSDARGCPFGCSYCSVHIVSGNTLRRRPVEEVLTELRVRGLLAGDDAFQVTFTNDLFGVGREDRLLLERIREELSGRPFRWLTQIGLRPLTDPSFLELVDSVGKATLIVGVESPFRKGLGEEKNGIRGVDPEAVFESVRRYPNISTRLLLMMGFDFEPADAFEQMLEFVKRIRPDGVYVSILTPFPGTPIGERLEAQGRIFERNWAYYDTRHLVFERHYERSDGSCGVMSESEFAAGFSWLTAQAEAELSRWSRFTSAARVL